MGHQRYKPSEMDERGYYEGSSSFKFSVEDLVKIANTRVGEKYNRAKDSAKAIKEWMTDLGLNHRKSEKHKALLVLRLEYILGATSELARREISGRRDSVRNRLARMTGSLASVIDPLPRNSIARYILKRVLDALDAERTTKQVVLNAYQDRISSMEHDLGEQKKALAGQDTKLSYHNKLFYHHSYDLPGHFGDFSERFASEHGQWKAAAKALLDTEEWMLNFVENVEEAFNELDFYLPGGGEYNFEQLELSVFPPSADAPSWEVRVNGFMVARSQINSNGENLPWFMDDKRINADLLAKIMGEADEVATALGYKEDTSLAGITASLEGLGAQTNAAADFDLEVEPSALADLEFDTEQPEGGNAAGFDVNGSSGAIDGLNL